MRKALLLLLSLVSVSCSNIAGVSAIGRNGGSEMCSSLAAPWVGLAAAPEVSLASGSKDPVLRAVTYNIHSGMGQWKIGWRSRAAVEHYLNSIAARIASASPYAPIDIVALNEVDFFAGRSGNMDQAHYLADALERRNGAHYDVVYGQTRSIFMSSTGEFGNAVLVRYTHSQGANCLFDDTRACGMADAPANLPGLRATGFVPRLLRQGRGVVKVTLDVDGHPVDVIATHLEAMAMPEREAQAAHLLRRFIDPARTTILLGDMNTVPTDMTRTRSFATTDRTHDVLTSGTLADARVLFDLRAGKTDFRHWATYPADAPEWPLDMALGSLDLIPEDVRVLEGEESDHRALYVAYRLTGDAATIAAQRMRHDTIRRRQLAQILQCDVVDTARSTKLQWLREGTQFFSLFPDETEALASVNTRL